MSIATKLGTGCLLNLSGTYPYNHMTFNQVVSLDHVTIWKIYTSITRILIIKLIRVRI